MTREPDLDGRDLLQELLDVLDDPNPLRVEIVDGMMRLPLTVRPGMLLTVDQARTLGAQLFMAVMEVDP